MRINRGERNDKWRNRIVRYSEESPDQLLANPQNFRTHPGSQAEVLRDVLRDVGIVQNVIANERTGHIIDGHLRVMEALKSGQQSIPVTWVDLSYEEESLILATFDPISALAGIDHEAVEGLLQDVSTDSLAVQGLLESLLHDESSTNEFEEPDSSIVSESVGEDFDRVIRQSNSGFVFFSDNEFGIPALELSPSVDAVPLPVSLWTGKASSAKTYYFDPEAEFEAIVQKESRISSIIGDAIIEPLLPLNSNAPAAVVLWNVFRKRLLMRLFQQRGFAVFVTLNSAPAWFDYNFLGVPQGWRQYAMFFTSSLSVLEMGYNAAIQHAGADDILFIVVSDDATMRQEFTERGWTFVEGKRGRR